MAHDAAKALAGALQSFGCAFQENGGSHDIRRGPDEQRTSSIPRHAEINTLTMT